MCLIYGPDLHSFYKNHLIRTFSIKYSKLLKSLLQFTKINLTKILHCLTNLTQKIGQTSEQRFLHNLRSLNPFLKSEMQKNAQFFHKSRAKCTKMEFLGIFGASAHLNGDTQISYFTANPSLGILFQIWEVENPFKITFSTYFGLKFTICHIPVINWEQWYIKIITGMWHIVNSKPK